MALLSFALEAITPFGSEVFAVGSIEALGNWRQENGLRLSTGPSEYPRWTAQVTLPDSSLMLGRVEYKFVILSASGSYIWESGENRQLALEGAGCSEGSTCPIASFGAIHVEAAQIRRCVQHAPNPSPTIFKLPKLNLALEKPAACCELEVEWKVVCAVSSPGDVLCVVGSHEKLGNWDPHLGLKLSTTADSFPHWSATLLLDSSAAEDIWWKLALLRPDHSIQWESVKDRCLALSEASLPQDGGFWHISVRFGETDAAMPLMTPRYKHAGSHYPPKNSRDIYRSSSSSSTFAPDCEEELTSDDGDTVGSTTPRGSMVWTPFASGGPENPQSPHSPGLMRERSGHGSSLCMPSGAVRREQPLQLWSGAYQLEKPGSRCEDSYFYSAAAMGVADGVGQMAQFAKYGTDSAAYATDIMEGVATALQRDELSSLPEDRAEAAMAYASDQAVTYGATTACVLVLDGFVAGVANLGDSGYMLLRFGSSGPDEAAKLEVVTRSREQQHSWNAPFQLLRLPPVLAARVQKANRKLDTAADCERYSVQLQPWDLLLLFSDGLVDNLYEYEILRVINRVIWKSSQTAEDASREGVPKNWADVARAAAPSAIAQALALAAQERSLDPDARVPFSDSSELQGQPCFGGKMDDITVVAAWVAPSEGLDSLQVPEVVTVGYPGRGSKTTRSRLSK